MFAVKLDLRTVMSVSEDTLPPEMADPRGLFDKNNLMEAMGAVGSDEALSKAFDILSSKSGKNKGHVSAYAIQRAMPILGVNLQVEEIDGIIGKEAKSEDDEMIDRAGFIRVMKNIWKSVADSMINDVEMVIDQFIPNKAKLVNANEKFINGLKDIWKRVADSKIQDAEKEIDGFISKKVEQENVGNTFRMFIDNLKGIWKRVADSMIHEVEREIDGFIPNMARFEIAGNIHKWFIDSLKLLWKRVVDSMINEVGKTIHEFISSKTELEKDGVIRDEFISNLKDIQKRVDDSIIKEKVASGEVLQMAHAKVLGERLGSNVTAALLLRLIPFLGGNIAETEIIAVAGMKKVKTNIVENDRQINCDEFVQIIRNIWSHSADYLSKAMREVTDPKEARAKAFAVLRNPLDEFVSATILRAVMLNHSEDLDFEELYQTIYQVVVFSREGRITKIIFSEIIDYVQYLIKKFPLEKIYGVLTMEKTRTVVLSGESGVGKTWMATKIAGRATNDGIFDFAIWVNLKGLSLRKIIAHQLSLLSASDDMETDKVKEVLGGNKKGHKSLGKRIREALQDKKVLLIFDGVNSCEELDKDLSQLLKLLHLKGLNENYKVLITTCDFDNFKQEYRQEAIRIEVRRWTNNESESFLSHFIGADRFSEVRDIARFYIKGSEGLPAKILIIAKTLSHFMSSDEGLQKLQGVKEVVLKDAAHDYGGYRNIENLFISTEVVPKIVLVDCYGSETPAYHFLNGGGSVHYNELISYWILEGHLGHFSCIEDAYDEGHRVLMELLDCGLLKPLKAGYIKSNGAKFNFSAQEYFHLYQNNRLGLATTFDNKLGNTVVGDGMIRTFPSDKEKEKRKEETEEEKEKRKEEKEKRKEEKEKKKAEEEKKKDRERRIQKEVEEEEKEKEEDEEEEEEEEEEKISTLLLDGDRAGEVSDNLFDSMEDLEILAIFDPTHKPFPLRMSNKWNLRFLVLRGCGFLTRFNEVFESVIPKPHEKPPDEARKPQKSVSDVRRDARTFQKSMSDPLPNHNSPDPSSIPVALSKLTVLEISGPSSLKTIPENLFDAMKNLKSLNMSSLQMEFLPESFYELTTIEILILKDCSSLKRMESLKKFEQLQLLDLSGATSLEAFKDKSFSENGELRMINLSQTRIAKFPVVHSLRKLQYLSLRNCPALIRVRKIGSVETLRFFDISGSKNVNELLDPGLQKLKNLFALNVSGTTIRRLPSTIGTPHHLHLSDCSNLKQLPPIETLSEVRVLDLSGSALLDDVKPEFIQSLRNLVRFNLSKTGVVHLPSLSSLVNLRSLLASQCQRLEKLEGLGFLIELEVLDLSGCKALLKIDDQSFDKMDRLDSLDLSETPLEELPSLSNLKKLKRLNLRGCTKLTNIPGLEDLPLLEDLDVSRTTRKVPIFKHVNCRRIVHGPKPSSCKNFDPIEIQEYLGVQQHRQASGETKKNLEPHQQASGETKVDCDDETQLTQEEMDQCDHWCILNRLASHNSTTSDKHVIDAHFLQLLKMYPEILLKEDIKFNFIVYPLEEAAHQSMKDKDLLRNEFVLKNNLFGNVFPGSCLEIRGFRDSPKFLGQLLEHAEMIVLTENSCIQLLSDLGADNLKKMKICGIERCNEMEYVTDEAKESADILWVSEAAKLKSICKETSLGIGFSALGSLYLEFCPELSSLSFSSKQLSGLKILHVKYCQNLVKLFDDKPAQLPKLQSLHLWALPALEQISCGMQSLLTLTVAHCPLLEYIFDPDISSQPNFTSLQLQVEFCESVKNIPQLGYLQSHLM